jgi:hypothetical protein
MILNNSESHAPQMADLFPQTVRKQRRTAAPQKQRTLKRMLSEVMLGRRPFLKVHSVVLQTDFWFVNEGLADPADRMFSGKIITMAMLAEIITARQPILRTVKELFRENI